MSNLPFTVDRTVVIRATPDIVFSFFTDSAKWAQWWGAGSSIDAKAGGKILINYPTGEQAVGEVVSIAPTQMVFTYGFTSGTPIAPGASRVTIDLAPVAQGTRLTLSHALADESLIAKVQGWSFQLTVFANAVSLAVHENTESVVDAWFGAWSETDATKREAMLRRVATKDIRFDDQFSMIRSVDELSPYIGMSQQYMPGVGLERAGAVRQCRDAFLVDWIAKTTDGQPRGAGTNVFELDASNRIAAVTGFWRGS
jgi:uncharacterized protein YndB with AHSA1/START domain